MSHPFTLFELSWEVCNKVGGIHTVLSTKARTATARLGDDYVAIGPWLLHDPDRDVPFDEEPGYEAFAETCRSQGVPVRVGRWRIPGRPLTILVEFSRLLEHRDDLLARLWEDFGVDSISGAWDYVEPVLFGLAAGMVIERWWEAELGPRHRRAIVHAHEWMTGSALLYVKPRLPSVGTVFTTHATMLGRALSSQGHAPSDGLDGRTPEELAEAHHVVAKHSLEGVCAREADVFTTVSEITAAEAELLHGRRPDVLLPNGIDLEVIDQIAGPSPRAAVRERLVAEAGRFLGEDVSDAVLLAVSGRYEFHNKGIDVLLDALGVLAGQGGDADGTGRRVVLLVLVPAGNSGLRSELLERRELPVEACHGPIGLSTHNLFDEATDPVHVRCQAQGLDNAPGSRVKVVQVPIYLQPGDGFLDEPYEAVLRAVDLSCFPSFYEPWGYTPQESLAVGVPTVTSDHAGFGRWVAEQGLGAAEGVTVLARTGRPFPDVVAGMVDVIEAFLATRPGVRPDIDPAVCRETAGRTAWRDLFAHYEQAYATAGEAIQRRSDTGVPQPRRPQRPLEVPPQPGPTPRLRHFDVTADLPPALRPLQRLAMNTWWCQDAAATALFRDLDPDLWETCGHNPVVLLQQVDPAVLATRADDAAYGARLERTRERFETYLGHERRLELTPEEGEGLGGWLSVEHPVAYFSAEFGIHESLPIYGGGLGVLAGDHVKAASDLGLPMVAVGLFYRRGYVHQRLTATGEQTEVDREFDPHTMPLERVRTAEGTPLEISIELPGRTLQLGAWRLAVGRVSIYLLDADTPSNREEDRQITRRLYAGDNERRLLQEIALGRGGQRLLRTLGVRPAVWHINEGHAAFFAVERVSRLMREEGLTFDAAREIVRATTVFTTHTPVPAGHDRFSEDLMRRYFSDAEAFGLPWERFFDLGRSEDGQFNMTWLALSFASKVNGVSKLHGIASRGLLKGFWPGLLEEEVPVTSVTNGVHLRTWTHPRIAAALGAVDRPVLAEDFAAAADADPEALWAARSALKRELVARARRALEGSFLARSDSPVTLHRMLEGLDERALLIGFARRFAPYKRAHLLFQDVARLERLLSASKRPVRILIAGKAHPRDERGKEILKEVAELTRSEALIGRVFFLENYDMSVARDLVQGVDVWLNTPTRMLEASGTSGMKAAANGALNLSIADGWWPEAYDGENGWVIAGDRVYDDQSLQDTFDGTVLYRLLEEEIVPLFFDRDTRGVPRGWIERIVRDLATVPPVFNTNRMVREYFKTAYKPLGINYFRYVKERKARPKALAREAQRIRRGFADVKVVEAHIADLAEIRAGEPIDVRLDLDIGSLRPEDLAVELVVGRASGETLQGPIRLPLAAAPTGNGAAPPGTVRFEGTHRIERSGRYAHGLRVRAHHADDPGGALKDLVFWA